MMERFTFENWELKSFGNPQNRGRVFALKRGARFHLDSWISFSKNFMLLEFKRKLGSKKRIQSWIASDRGRRGLPFHSGMFGGYLSFQKLTSCRFRRIFFQDSTGGKNSALGPPTREAATVRFKALAAHTVHLLWKELRMLCRYSMIFLQPKWWVFTKWWFQKLCIQLYMYIHILAWWTS